jgi:replicative DNA helicase
MERNNKKYSGVDKLIELIFNDINQQFGTPESITGLKLGLRELDMILAGLHGGQLYAIASRTSMGKTALVTTIAANISLKGKLKVGFVSLQSSKYQLIRTGFPAISRYCW